MDRISVYFRQNGRNRLTPKQSRRLSQKELAGHVECDEGREYDGSPTGRCVVCGRDEDNMLTLGTRPLPEGGFTCPLIT